MKIKEMVLYFCKKNKVKKKEVVKILNKISIFKAKGFSDKKILSLIPDHAKSLNNDKRIL